MARDCAPRGPHAVTQPRTADESPSSTPEFDNSDPTPTIPESLRPSLSSPTLNHLHPSSTSTTTPDSEDDYYERVHAHASASTSGSPPSKNPVPPPTTEPFSTSVSPLNSAATGDYSQQLLTVNLTLCRRVYATFLVDSGASRNFIDSNFCKKHRLHLSNLRQYSYSYSYWLFQQYPGQSPPPASYSPRRRYHLCHRSRASRR